MRVRGWSERNPLLDCQLNDPGAWVNLVHRLWPTSRGKTNPDLARANGSEGFINESANLCIWPMTVNFDQIEMGETINQPRRSYFANTAKVIGVYCVNIPAFKLRRAIGHTVKHLIGAIKEMN